MTTATDVNDLDLPDLTLLGLDRDQQLAANAAAREKHWLAKTMFGVAVTHYDDAVSVLRDRRFHSALSLLPQLQGISDSGFETERRQSILSMEGEPHARLRRLVARAFTPMAADALRPFMRSVIGDLIAGVDAQGGGDFVELICEPYPIPIICELLGAPPQDWRLFSDWATNIFKIFNGTLAEDLPAVQQAGEELEQYVTAMIERRRRDPADDLLSTMIAIEEAGDRLSTDELIMMAEAVLMAGTDTTRNQLACTMALFATHPQQWTLLAQQSELAGKAVEESMRYLGAVRGTMRVASEPIEIRGVAFPQGTLVNIPLASANRDDDHFDTPNVFDITAERTSVQMTFGSGVHYCLGAALARAELQEALTLLVERWPTFTLNGTIEWKPETFGIWGPAKLPVLWSNP